MHLDRATGRNGGGYPLDVGTRPRAEVLTDKRPRYVLDHGRDGSQPRLGAINVTVTFYVEPGAERTVVRHQ
ncbi:hypothetical protein ACTI_75560 [Actinoplanes sp. OR16]|nr:hypothetical protein ACTI_75560 [Actinoplanes sp. OR16]